MEAALLALLVGNIFTTVGLFMQLNNRIDKLTEQIQSMDRRLAHIEGQLGVPLP